MQSIKTGSNEMFYIVYFAINVFSQNNAEKNPASAGFLIRVTIQVSNYCLL